MEKLFPVKKVGQTEMASEKNDKEENTEELEREHFMKVVSAFLHYEKFSNLRIEKAKKDFLSLDAKDRGRLPQFLENLEKQKQCVAKNFEFIKQIIGHTGKTCKLFYFNTKLLSLTIRTLSFHTLVVNNKKDTIPTLVNHLKLITVNMF